MIDGLGFCAGGGRNWLGIWMRAAIAWFYVVWASKLSWFLSGWAILTYFQCGGSNLAWFQFRDRNCFVLCMGVKNDLILVSVSKLTWILCDDIRPQIDITTFSPDWVSSIWLSVGYNRNEGFSCVSSELWRTWLLGIDEIVVNVFVYLSFNWH